LKIDVVRFEARRPGTKEQGMRFWKDENGQALVMAIMFMTMLLGFMALAVDVGILFRARRVVQTTADAAAVAAALDYKFNQNLTTARNAGLAATTTNGYTNGTKGVVVNVNQVTTGLYATCSGCFEATVKVPNPTFFMSLFSISSVDVGARAVAGRGTWENCMILLGGTGADFDATGAATVNLTNCGLVDDSSSSNAFTSTGAITMTARSIGVVGGTSIGGASSITPTPVTGISPSGDPLGLSAPSTAGCGAALSYGGSTNATIGPGCYNGLSMSGSSILHLNPGLYVFNGTIGLSGATTISGTGVTIFFNSMFTSTGAVTMNLSAPTSGAWNGILFFESPADSDMLALTGAAASNLTGIVYLPNAKLDMTGAASMNLYLAFVVKQLQSTGAISLTLNDYLIKNPNSPLATVTLLE
jgi:hypothetical protein